MGITAAQAIADFDEHRQKLEEVVKNIRRCALLLLTYRNDYTAQEQVDKVIRWAAQLPVIQGFLESAIIDSEVK